MHGVPRSQTITARSEASDVTACLIIAPVLWGGNFVVGSMLAPDLSAHWTNLLRWVIAAVALLPFCGRAAWAYRHVLVRSWKQLTVLGILGVAGFNSVLYAGLKTAPVSVAAIAFAVTPFLITAIVAVMKREPPSGRLLFAAAIAFCGMVLAQWKSVQGGTPAAGIALVLLAAVIWALYCVGLRRFTFSVPARVAFFAQVVIGTAVLLPIALLLQEPPALSGLERQHWLGLFYLGLCAAALAFWLWQRGIAGAGAARASIFMNLVPISSLMLSVAFLGAPIAGVELLAFALVLFGIGVALPSTTLTHFRARLIVLLGVTIAFGSLPQKVSAAPMHHTCAEVSNRDQAVQTSHLGCD